MSNRGPGRSAELERQWRDRVRRHRSSGVSVRAFCAAEAIPESAFYFWRRELTERERRRRSNGRPRFVPVEMASESASSAMLEVVLGGGRTVRVSAGFDAEHLRAVVTALEATPC